MAAEPPTPRLSGADRRQFTFRPRIINPVRVGTVLLCSADETIRNTRHVVETEMPWTRARVVSSPSALAELRSTEPTVLVCDDVALNFVDVGAVRRANDSMVVALLSFHPLVQCAPPSVALRQCPYTAKADLVFAASRSDFPPDRIITSVVRSAEDHLNIAWHPDVRRFIFLIVDDEPRWFSQFLPVLYGIIGQRADVKITRTYEETLRFLFGVDREGAIQDPPRGGGYGDEVVCVITDMYFPKEDHLDSDAGKDLIRLVKRYYPRIPVIIASKAQEATELAEAGFVLPKGDPGSLDMLSQYIRDVTGIGDLVIPGFQGRQMRRLKDLRELYELLLAAEGQHPEARHLRDVLGAYGDLDKFSTWLYMHSFRNLGDRLRPQRARGERMVTVLKREVRREMLRMLYTPLIVGGVKVYTLRDLAALLRDTPAEVIQPLADHDVLSSWLDRKGYSELADELRPIHGRGPELGSVIAAIVERWIVTYQARVRNLPHAPPVI